MGRAKEFRSASLPDAQRLERTTVNGKPIENYRDATLGCRLLISSFLGSWPAALGAEDLVEFAEVIRGLLPPASMTDIGVRQGQIVQSDGDESCPPPAQAAPPIPKLNCR